MRIAQQILAVTHVASFLHPHTTFYSSRTSNVLLSPRVSNYRTCSRHHAWRAVASASSSSSASPSSSCPFPANLRGVLFDMDGTLSDSESLHFKAYQVVFAKQLPEWSASHGPMTRDYYNKNMGGKTKLSALAQLLPNASPAERDSLCHDLEETFNVLAKSELKPLPGVYELMDLLKKNKVKRALVTNAPPSEMRYAIDLLNLSGQFDACVPSAECKAAKPHPEPYLEGLRRLALEPSSCVAVEDSAAGISSATAAGLFTIGVTTSRSAAEIMAMGAHMAIADFEDQTLAALVRKAVE